MEGLRLMPGAFRDPTVGGLQELIVSLELSNLRALEELTLNRMAD